MTGLGKDFKDFLELFNRHEVQYLIAGGFAVAIHGQPRYTKDIDIWLSTELCNAVKMECVLRDFGFESMGLKAADFTEMDTVIQLGREPNRIDLLTELKGLQFANAYEKRLTVRLSEIEVCVLDRQSLILNKQVVGRPQDLLDASKLLGG